ncbi:MAG: COP23 domain-containing protein [Cyanobacteria bacterium P01_A01_bin.84]
MTEKNQGSQKSILSFCGKLFTTGATIAGLFFAYAQYAGWELPIFSPNTRFSCTLQPDTKNGGEVWTVMYRNHRGKRSWLRMVNSFGDDWNTRKRCDRIAERLERFREDGLTHFGYRTDPNTPSQSVICAFTQIDRQNCNLLVTLKPGADGYESLSKMFQALKSGTTVDQNSGSRVIVSSNSSKVNIENLLVPEDRKVKK